jgi:multiple sugar transport system substrate-binding protein
MSQVLLRGITWNHSRAMPPLVATAQRFEELHAGVRIQWEKRSLHEFGHADITTLAGHFDLLVIDHPMVGDAEATGALADLLPLLSFDDLQDFQDDSLGGCFSSYLYNERLYALPIDASAPAASFRPDLFDQHGLKEPRSWGDLMELARLGWVWMPGFSADIFLNFLGLCVSRGSAVAADPEQLVNPEIGMQCLEQLSELARLMPDEVYGANPIAVYERMAKEDSIAYCPFAYTYSNYARDGFGKRLLRFSHPVALDHKTPMRTVLGGTGIAIPASCKQIPLALEYSLFVAGRTCQRTLYGMGGGQPARRSAWHDALLNQITDDFFSRTTVTIETAYVRPRYRGYVRLQESGGEAIVDYCKYRVNTRQTLERINVLYRASLKGSALHA